MGDDGLGYIGSVPEVNDVVLGKSVRVDIRLLAVYAQRVALAAALFQNLGDFAFGAYGDKIAVQWVGISQVDDVLRGGADGCRAYRSIDRARHGPMHIPGSACQAQGRQPDNPNSHRLENLPATDPMTLRGMSGVVVAAGVQVFSMAFLIGAGLVLPPCVVGAHG